jgi:hypothetical protein
MMRVHQMIALLTALPAAGCAAQERGCRSDADCAASVCVDGACRPLVGAVDLGTAPASAELGSLPDLRSPVADGGPLSADALAAICPFNGDGVLDRSEEPFVVGLGALFAVNPAGSTTPVSLTAVVGVWDFTAPVRDEVKVFDELQPPGGQWWSAEFPSATYAERLVDGQNLLGVYRATADRLELLGLVSDQTGLTQTLLSYATAIPLLQFPLRAGASWSADSDVSGTLNGVVFAGHDHYDFSVDQRGMTKVPAGNFDTLRLRIRFEESYGLYTVSRITYLHLAECYGAVARIRSQDGETSNDFTQAAEYRRLATQ